MHSRGSWDVSAAPSYQLSQGPPAWLIVVFGCHNLESHEILHGPRWQSLVELGRIGYRGTVPLVSLESTDV